MVHNWNLLWDWNTLESVRRIHSFLEGWALVFFGLLVLFDVLAHLSQDENPTRAKRFERIGLWFFGVAIFAEILAYPYSQRNDTLSSQQDAEQRAKIAELDNSTQRLKTDAENAHKQAEGFKAQIADSAARAKSAEAQVASAKAASDAASAKAETFRLDIAKANESAKQAEARAAEANLELARFKAPRTLSPSQQASISDRLRKFGARRVDVIIIGDAPEITDITRLIAAAIQQAGWTVNFVGKAISGPNISGVLIGTHIGSDRNLNEAADTLVSALQSAGIASSRSLLQFDDKLPMAIMGSWDEKNVAPIRMLVSAKP
jgi:hypothetical protein